MKARHLPWILSLSLLVLPGAAGADASMDAMEAMLQRVSVRKFDTARKVTDGELRKIMDAGYRTQTMDGSSPFEFIQIRSKKTLQGIVGKSKFADWMVHAPAAIAVVVRTKDSPQLYKENGAVAWLNMAYKAQSMGLGTCFLGTANRQAMKQLLGLGKNQHLVTVMPVGAPREGFGQLKSPRRYPVEWTVSQGRFGGQLKLLGSALPSPRTGTPMGAFLSGKQTRVESFSERPVEQGKLATALEAMRHAPSSKNKQHWRWVMVTDKATKQQVARISKDRSLADAPVVAVLAGSQDSRPFVNPKNWSKRRQSPYFINHGAAMAMRNLQIGAESQGLGVRIKALNRKGDSGMRALLSQGKALSGKRVRFIAAVGMGYAARSSTRQASALPGGRVHKERFGGRRPNRR